MAKSRHPPEGKSSPVFGNSIAARNEIKANRIFLHVGCGHKRKDQTTAGFDTPEWDELRFDIDESVSPDIVGSIADMSAVASASVDAIFSSHNIEHLYLHEVAKALGEFRRVLKPEGFLVITCPDLQSICALVAEDKLADPAYLSPAGPITPLDILYGHRMMIASGNVYMAHRSGFTRKLLAAALQAVGFRSISATRRPYPFFDLWMIAKLEAVDGEALANLAAEHLPK